MSVSPGGTVGANRRLAEGGITLPHRSCASVLVTLIVSISFIILPALQIIDSSAAFGTESTFPSDVGDADGPYFESLRAFKTRTWDWSSYADDEGFVKVIVSERYSGKYSEDVVGAFRTYQTGSFSIVFQGFTARVSLDILDKYASGSNPLVDVYPDLPVNATVGDNIVQVGADQVWSMTDSHGSQVRGTGIVVAVIDTGIFYTHPDLGGGFGPSYKVIGGYDFYNRDSDPLDDNGHGTHVAGIIAADGNMTGVAPDAKLLAYKALGSDGSGSMSNVILAVERAMDPNNDGNTADHADVISMSLGGSGDEDDPICQAVQSAIDAGVVVVIAAGNSGPGMGTVASPGVAANAITVGAINKTGALATFSSRGVPNSLTIKPEISAPGVNILSTVPFSGTKHSSSSGYSSMSGTSMATPHVSGAVALLLQLHPTWTPAQVKSALISGSSVLEEPLWLAGAGGLWVPGATGQRLFAVQPLISYGFAGDTSQSFTVSNSGSAISLTSRSSDRYSMSADGSAGVSFWSNASASSPPSLSIAAGSGGQVSLSVSIPSASAPEGYYEGAVQIVGSGASLRVPFGFALLSKLTVHVLNMDGAEVFDPYGGVWVYNTPEANIAVGVRGDITCAPPATFMLPSGQYSVHALGHQLIYTYSDPYILSGTINLGRLARTELNLTMTSAKRMVMDLATEEGNPIYVKDYRVYSRYVGTENNVSFHLVGSDYSATGSALFSLRTSQPVYVSTTAATVGISIAGYSYSSGMWDFMARNWDHWYESSLDSSTNFYIESSSDLQYLLAWEFQGVTASTSTDLSIDPSKVSTYDTKYDIPGALQSVWGNWGTHLAIGGDSSFYMRRDTDTSLNPFFSGMTRRTIVQGVWSEPYFYGNLFDGYFVRQFYSPDYTHANKADTMSDLYLPDRNFIQPIDSQDVSERLGEGPFYPSVRTENTNGEFVLFHPLLRDRSDAVVGGMYVPTMRLYRDGGLSGIYQLSEYLSRLPAKRIVDLIGNGVYTAEISYKPTPQICDDVTITLQFTVPSSDVDPPEITGLAMSQRFVPGASLPISVTAHDDDSSISLEMSWRPSGTSAWQTLSVTPTGLGTFNASIQIPTSAESLDLMLRATDSSGNYIEYTALHVSKKQVPVIFDLSADKTEVGYRNGDASVVLSGTLTDIGGNPLHATAAVPLELMLNNKKIAMILDENCVSGSHTHDGAIRFEWHFNPARIFTGPNQVANILVEFDFGIYQKVSQTITLNSIQYTNLLPNISLISPANNSLIRQGVPVQLSITDDGTFTAKAYRDGTSLGELLSPFQVPTTTWSDGNHVLRVSVTDDDAATVESSYSFSVDVYDPLVQIIYPEQGKKVPMNSKLTATVTDSHLGSVNYTVDGGGLTSLVSPFEVDMTGWETGYHTVMINASDMVGRYTVRSVTFEISSGTIVLSLDSPHDGAVIKPGVPLSFSAVGPGNMTFRWSEGGFWYNLGTQRVISTTGWTEGLHAIFINATNDLRGFDQIQVEIIIDGTLPTISLLSHLNMTDVDASQVIQLSVSDQNFYRVTWTVFGRTWSSFNSAFSVSMTPPPLDGYFTIGVVAVDKANNTGTATFTFLMDHGPPEISFKNIGPNEAIAPGTDIDVDVEDFLVASVSWTVEDEPKQALADPYIISTDSFESGWHYLQIEAMDGCGKKNWTNISLYLDSTAPTVQVDDLGTVSKNLPCEVTALIQDDFMVDYAELLYELSGGSFESIAMIGSGANYSATIESNQLWDGMKLFVRANDTVGNTARSADLVVDVTDTPPGDDDQGGGQGEDTSMFGWLFGSMPGLLTMLAIASSVIIAFFMMTRTRRVKGSGRPYRPSTSRRPSYAATYGTSSSAFPGTSPKPRPTSAVQVSRLVTRNRSVVTQGAVPMTYRSSAPSQRSAPVRPAATVVQAPPRPPVSRSPAGQDKISRVTPNSPVSDLESLFTPQMMSGLQIKKALDAEKKRQRGYT